MRQTFLMRWEDTKPVPVVLVALVAGLVLFTVSDAGLLGSIGTIYAHLVHNSIVHHLGILALWPFFFVLGAEIKLNNVVAAGRVLIFAIIGGMLIPFGLTAALLLTFTGYAFAVVLATSAGAIATDVALSVGAMQRFQQSAKNSHWVELSAIALIILAIGDDLGGVIAMTFGFSSGLLSKWALFAEGMLCVVLWLIGNNARITFRVFNTEGINKKLSGEERDYHIITLIEHPAFWFIAALFNTWFLALAGIEPILGGCLVMIFAPPAVKEKLEYMMLPWSLRGLVVFGIIAGAVNLFNPEAWGIVTLLTFIGGCFGKQIGIFIGAYIGLRYTPKDDRYGINHFNYCSAYAMALSGAINGTVAIVFVNVAYSAGYISELMAQQATLGYLLTIPFVYLLTFIFAPIFARIQTTQDS